MDRNQTLKKKKYYKNIPKYIRSYKREYPKYLYIDKSYNHDALTKIQCVMKIKYYSKG